MSASPSRSHGDAISHETLVIPSRAYAQSTVQGMALVADTSSRSRRTRSVFTILSPISPTPQIHLPIPTTARHLVRMVLVMLQVHLIINCIPEGEDTKDSAPKRYSGCVLAAEEAGFDALKARCRRWALGQFRVEVDEG